MVCVWYEDARDETEGLLLWKSDISGKVLSGGTKTVERDPLLNWLLSLSMERMVRIETVGEAESGIKIGGCIESLFKTKIF
jgi:hypothetical protein